MKATELVERFGIDDSVWEWNCSLQYWWFPRPQDNATIEKLSDAIDEFIWELSYSDVIRYIGPVSYTFVNGSGFYGGRELSAAFDQSHVTFLKDCLKSKLWAIVQDLTEPFDGPPSDFR